MLPVPTLLSIAGWGAEGVALWVLLGGFGSNPGFWLSEFFYATATLAGALVPVPGGLGITEALLQNQLVHLGKVEPAQATAAMILVRLATLWWAVLVGFVALGVLKVRFPGLTEGSLTDERKPGAGPSSAVVEESDRVKSQL
jgi:uncharacterized protein (TIRG00374 family)